MAEGKESRKIRNIRKQLSEDRDFQNAPPPSVQYAICCTHRSGSNLLSEALYQTGLAGDPLEYFNIDFLKLYAQERGLQNVNIYDFLDEMRSRRTSPNGVFGLNVKYDQIEAVIKNVQLGQSLVKNSDFVVFLYRKNKIRQAVSTYKGQMRGVFNVWKGDELEEDTSAPIPLNAERITQTIKNIINMENKWQNFFQEAGISYMSLAYEDLIADYNASLLDVLHYIGVDAASQDIPEPPTEKVRDWRDDQLIREYADHIDPMGELGAHQS